MINPNITQEEINTALLEVKERITQEHFDMSSCFYTKDGSVEEEYYDVPINICNSVMCIGGWLSYVLQKDKSLNAHDIKGGFQQLNTMMCVTGACKGDGDYYRELSLFYPKGYVNTDFTIEQAHKAIDNYIANPMNDPWEGVI